MYGYYRKQSRFKWFLKKMVDFAFMLVSVLVAASFGTVVYAVMYFRPDMVLDLIPKPSPTLPHITDPKTPTPWSPQPVFATPAPADGTFATPLPPAAASVAEKGWKSFNSRGMEIWLPAWWWGASPDQDVAALIEQLRASGLQGPQFERNVQILQEGSEDLVLVAFDWEINPSGAMTGLEVRATPADPSTTLEAKVAEVMATYSAGSQVVESQVVTVNGFEAQHLIVETTVLDTAMKQAKVLLKAGERFWQLTFSTGTDDFARLSPVFEESLHTLSIQP